MIIPPADSSTFLSPAEGLTQPYRLVHVCVCVFTCLSVSTAATIFTRGCSVGSWDRWRCLGALCSEPHPWGLLGWFQALQRAAELLEGWKKLLGLLGSGVLQGSHSVRLQKVCVVQILNPFCSFGPESHGICWTQESQRGFGAMAFSFSDSSRRWLCLSNGL